MSSNNHLPPLSSSSPQAKMLSKLDYQRMGSESFAEELRNARVADAIDILNDLSHQESSEIINHLPISYAIEIFDKPELNEREIILEKLPPIQAVNILNGLSADEATDIFKEMSESTKKYLFVLLNSQTRSAINSLTKYPESSAGALMTTEFVTVPSSWNVEETISYIKEVEPTRETVYASYIIDPETNKLIKAVSLRELILADPKENILKAGKHSEPVAISPDTEREDVAKIFRRYDLLSVAVIDEDQHVIGIVTVDDVLESMTDDMTSDAYKFGGVENLEDSYLRTSFFSMLKKRGGWLSILFLSEMFTATAMQYFEDQIEKAIVLSLFLPLIMSSGGNSGSQATSLIIRALALREVQLKDWWRVLRRELPAGIALGTFLGIIGILRITMWQFLGFYDYGSHWFLLALTICVALIGIVTFGSVAGSMLPFLLKKIGFDPASASAPFIATLVDVTGIVIYFSIAALMLKGVIL